MGYDFLGIVGTTVGDQYLVEEAVGEGSFSVVYRATHRVWQLPVALKCFKGFDEAPPETRARLARDFVQEGAVLSQLSGRNASIVQARDAGVLMTGEGALVPYIVLEWLEGQTLEAVLEEQRRDVVAAPWSMEQVTRVVEPVALALAMVHRRGIAHRDIKPANIWVGGGIDAEDTYVKLLDFGVAKVVNHRQSERFQRTGGFVTSFTPAYGAPEQFSRRLGATGPWSDVYALALVFVELLAGHPAVQGDDFIELGMAAIDPERRPTPRALGIAVSDELESVLAKALAVNPDDRFVDAGVFWEAMRHALRSDPGGASDHRRERRTWSAAAAAALVFGALLGSSAYSSWPIAHRFWQAVTAEASELRARWPAARRDAPSAERAVGTPEMATAQGI
jgi:serine/threonine protein kinase